MHGRDEGPGQVALRGKKNDSLGERVGRDTKTNLRLTDTLLLDPTTVTFRHSPNLEPVSCSASGSSFSAQIHQGSNLRTREAAVGLRVPEGKPYTP